jgi:hypothetical protein
MSPCINIILIYTHIQALTTSGNEYKHTRIGNSIKRKTTMGQPNPVKPLLEDKAST